MYGRIGSFNATPGQREELVSILLESTSNMPGCLSYIVSRDVTNADTVWITEVWDSKESHAASLALPAVRAAITRARPIIASFGSSVEVEPVGGQGLK